VVTYEQYQTKLLAEAHTECDRANPVVRSITYHRFVSRSKGRRNGRQRLRRNWKEVHLVRYRGGYHLWHRFPFDVYATEIIGKHADGEMLKEAIIDRWGY